MMITSGSTHAFGETISQLITATPGGGGLPLHLDMGKILRFASLGFLLHGPLSYCWLTAADRSMATVGRRWPRPLRTVALVFADQIAWGPFWIIVSCVLLRLAEGRSLDGLVQFVAALCVQGWTLWIPGARAHACAPRPGPAAALADSCAHAPLRCGLRSLRGSTRGHVLRIQHAARAAHVGRLRRGDVGLHPRCGARASRAQGAPRARVSPRHGAAPRSRQTWRHPRCGQVVRVCARPELDAVRHCTRARTLAHPATAPCGRVLRLPRHDGTPAALASPTAAPACHALRGSASGRISVRDESIWRRRRWAWALRPCSAVRPAGSAGLGGVTCGGAPSAALEFAATKPDLARAPIHATLPCHQRMILLRKSKSRDESAELR